MRNSLRWTILPLSILLAIQSSISHANDPRTVLPAKAENMSRIIFADNPTDEGAFSYIYGVVGQEPNTSVVSCTGGIKEGNCANANSLMMNFIVPPCNDNSKLTDMCIKDLSFANANGTLEKAKLLYEVASPKYAANESAKTPAAGGVSVWQGPSINNTGGTNTYGVRIGIRYNIDYNPKTRDPGIAYVFGFNAEVVPVSFVTGSQYKLAEGFNGGSQECVWTETEKCATPQEFGAPLPISLSFQMDNRITGWLSGRMKDTNIDFQQLSPTTNLLTVTGTPIDVPLGYADLTVDEVIKSPGALATFSNKDAKCDRPIFPNSTCGIPQIWRFQSDRLNWQWGPYFQERFKVLAADPNGFKAFEEKYFNVGFAGIFQEYLKTFPVRNSKWKLTGLDRSGFREGNWPECITDKTKFNGVITTNAMLMDVSPARFEDGSLVYDVAGAHLAYDGSVFKGTYDLVMSSSVARCLYQFSSAPIKATISIIAADGSVQNIATEVVGERNGWLTLSANNFTFSAPTIKIKLFQDAPAKPAVNKSVTISCVKGKITKKVTGISPKCPSGYKKK
jgi:hypothetical protein